MKTESKPIGCARAPWPRSPAEEAAGVEEDSALGCLAAPPGPPSAWYEAEREAHGRLLASRRWDVLVVPFQVQGRAVDRAGRSLMARYLAARLADSGHQVAPVTLAARALGETGRVFGEASVIRLADAAGARWLLRGYAGHDRNGHLRITLLVQERTATGGFGAPKVLDWPAVAFTDETPPEEAFRRMIEDVVSRLPLKGGVAPSPRDPERPATATFPENPVDFIPGDIESPLERALRLQLLGSLFPGEGPIREGLFERSLVALAEVAPESPGARTLRARALHRLQRRPEAVAALGTTATAPGRAMAAFLEGDLTGLAPIVAAIPDARERILASVDLADLGWAYKREPAADEVEGAVSGLPAAWARLVRARLYAGSRWATPDARDAAVDLARMLLPPEVPPGGNAALFVPETRRRALAWSGDDASRAVRGDLLDLLGEIAREASFHAVRSSLNPRGLPAEALESMDRLEPAYGGHPDLSFLRAEALRRSGAGIADARTVEALYRSALFWWGGQRSGITDTRTGFPLSTTSPQHSIGPRHLWAYAYDEDWPHRAEWAVGVKGDRDALDKGALTGRNATSLDPVLAGYRRSEVLLLYSTTETGPFSRYLEAIRKQRGEAAATDFLLRNERRFRGHPHRVNLPGPQSPRSGNFDDAVRRCEEEISASPEAWTPYVRLGNLWLARGEFAKAAEAYGRYPLFRAAKVHDRLALANNAFVAGQNLWRRGEAELARPFLEIAARAGSGGEAEAFAAIFLAFLEERFPDARDHALAAVDRYGNESARAWAAVSLGILGESDRAKGMLEGAWEKKPGSLELWLPTLVTWRLSGASDEEILAWASAPRIRDAQPGIGEHLLVLFTLDREPPAALPAWIRDIRLAARRARNPGAKPPASEELPDPIDLGYVALASGDAARAAQLFGDPARYAQSNRPVQARAFVWAATAAARTGKAAEAEKALEAAQPPPGTASGDFPFLLVKALLRGEQGDHEAAVLFLRQAHWNLPTGSGFGFPPMYRLVETCEQLYADTGDPRYRDLALTWARAYRRTYPQHAWAWAVEARFTGDPARRRRALATALYLDRRSVRANALPEPERREALDWLERNNPFQPPGRNGSQ